MGRAASTVDGFSLARRASRRPGAPCRGTPMPGRRCASSTPAHSPRASPARRSSARRERSRSRPPRSRTATGSAGRRPTACWSRPTRHGSRVWVSHAAVLDERASFRDAGLALLAWRVPAELRRGDTAAPLAIEGLLLEILAGAARERELRLTGTLPRWLSEARDYLHDPGQVGSLGELADGGRGAPRDACPRVPEGVRLQRRRVPAVAPGGARGAPSWRRPTRRSRRSRLPRGSRTRATSPTSFRRETGLSPSAFRRAVGRGLRSYPPPIRSALQVDPPPAPSPPPGYRSASGARRPPRPAG